MPTHSISASAAIAAPRAVVWDVLRDVARYPEWNPFTTHVDTTFEVGAPVRMRVALRDPLVVPQRGVMTSCVPGTSFSWRVTLMRPGLLVADRVQRLTDLPGGGTRYDTTDALVGWGVPVVAALTGRWVQRGFTDLAAALQARCER